MSAGTTSFRSILDKPLNQLTEDDISQLTREDCRKYLKDKGFLFYILTNFLFIFRIKNFYFHPRPSLLPPFFPVPETSGV